MGRQACGGDGRAMARSLLTTFSSRRVGMKNSIGDWHGALRPCAACLSQRLPRCWSASVAGGQAGDCAPRICRAVFVRGVGQTGGLCRGPVPALADAVRKKTGAKDMAVEFLMVTPPTASNGRAGQGDLECGSTTNNAERRQKVAFTVPPLHHGRRLLTKASSSMDRLPRLAGQNLVRRKAPRPSRR